MQVEGKEKAQVGEGMDMAEEEWARAAAQMNSRYLGAGSSCMSSKKSLMMFSFCSMAHIDAWLGSLHKCHHIADCT